MGLKFKRLFAGTYAVNSNYYNFINKYFELLTITVIYDTVNNYFAVFVYYLIASRIIYINIVVSNLNQIRCKYREYIMNEY